MRSNELLFRKLFTSSLLYYSWVKLKRELKYSFYSTKSQPISKNWFDKTSILIRNGSFTYSNSECINLEKIISKKKFLFILKNRIIENAFVILLEPFFKVDFSFKSFNLTECLRLYLR